MAIIALLIIIGASSGFVAFDSGHDTSSRWMAFTITVICLLGGLFIHIKDEWDD